MAFVYILKCSDNSYYTGSTKNIELRLWQHQNGEGAIHTKKRLPVELVYIEELERVDDAFAREKQIQGWSRSKKEALINSKFDALPELAIAYRDKNKLPELSMKTAEVLEAERYTDEFESLTHRENKLPDNHLQQLPEVSNKNTTKLPEALEGNGESQGNNCCDDGFESLNHLVEKGAKPCN